MKNKFLILLVFVIIAVIGILVFQFFWIIDTYTFNKNKITKEINKAIEVSLQKELNDRYSNFTKIKINDELVDLIPNTATAKLNIKDVIMVKSDNTGGKSDTVNLKVFRRNKKQIESNNNEIKYIDAGRCYTKDDLAFIISLGKLNSNIAKMNKDAPKNSNKVLKKLDSLLIKNKITKEQCIKYKALYKELYSNNRLHYKRDSVQYKKALLKALNKEKIARKKWNLKKSKNSTLNNKMYNHIMLSELNKKNTYVDFRTYEYNKKDIHKIDSIVQALINKNYKKDSINEEFSFNLNINRTVGNISNINDFPAVIGYNIEELLTNIVKSEYINRNFFRYKKFDSIVRAELKSREIDGDYFIERYDASKQILLDVYKPENKKGNSFLYSDFVPTTLIRNGYIRLGFPDDNKIVLSKMIGQITSTGVLLFFTLVILIYMLYIIYSQKKLSEIKNDFINNMTHEFKTPIATVSAAVEAMQKFNVLDDKIRTEKYLEVSSKELSRLTGLVEKVLNIARYEKNTLKLNLELVNINQLIENIIDSRKLNNVKKDIIINNNIVDKELSIMVDRVHFTNSIINLIDNSIKYSNESVKINIDVISDNDKVIFKIEDNGIGIANKYLNKIFEKFYRIPSGNIHKVKGFGLGLHYVKNIIEQHMGTISVKSKLNEGSTFIITMLKKQNKYD